MIASLPLSDPMVPEHDDFRKLLTATSELHKLDFRRQVRAPWQCDATRRMRRDAMQRDAILCGYCCAVLASPRSGVSRTHAQPYVRTAVACGHTSERRAPRLPPRGGGEALAYRRKRSVGTQRT